MLTKHDYEELEGTRIGDFILESYISHGGQAVIYKVKSSSHFKRDLALKIFGLASTADPRSIKAGLREIDASVLDHKSVIKYFPGGEDRINFNEEDHTVVFIPMEYTPLGSCDDGSPFSKDIALGEIDYKSIISLLDGLGAIHKAGIIHEDIKPANILKFIVREDGEVFTNLVITDFGISKMSSAFGVRGDDISGATFSFMSPEQLDHKHSEKGDIYSMGATLYYLITGNEPITVSGIQRDMHLVWQKAHQIQPRPNPRNIAPECHPRLALLVMRMMSVLSKDRPNVEECKDEIKKIIELDKDIKYNNHKPSAALEKHLQSNNLPIYYVADFPGVFKPEVHTHCKTTFYVFQIEMKHAVYIQYRSLIEKLTSYFSDSFSLYETWGQKDAIVLLWSNPETVEKFEKDFKTTFYGSDVKPLSASKIHHFPSQDFKALDDPHLILALAIQENKKVSGLTDEIKAEYIYRYFPANVPENSVRAFTFIEAVDKDDGEKFRPSIVSSVKEIIEKLVKNIDPSDKERCIRKPRVIEFNKNQSKICLIDFVAKNYSFLVDVPTQIIEEFGENAVKTTTFLETRRVVFQSDKILF